MHVVGQRSVHGGSSAVSLACIISMYFVQRFPAASLFVWPLDHSFHSFTPNPPPLYFSSDKSVWQVPGPISVGAHGRKARVYQGLACSRRSDSRVRCSDGGERVKSYTEETRENKRGKSGASSLPLPSLVSPVFFPRQFFDRALLSEHLEQANQGLGLPKFEAPGQTRHPPPLNDAVVKERWNICLHLQRWALFLPCKGAVSRQSSLFA